jgi:ribosome-binding factor A
MSKIRQQRTAEQIQIILSELFQRHMQDPRLQGLTVTQVMIDRELQHANVYVNALGDESMQADVEQALTKAAGFLRKELAARMRIRSIPQLHFHWDFSLAYAAEVDQILENLEIPPAEDDAGEI